MGKYIRGSEEEQEKGMLLTPAGEQGNSALVFNGETIFQLRMSDTKKIWEWLLANKCSNIWLGFQT